MSVLTLWLGNRDPSIQQTISVGSVAVNLTGKTVRFKMRPVNSSSVTVDAVAVKVDGGNGVDGKVRHDWGSDPAEGYYLAWWEVTTTATGKKQDYNETVIEFRKHGTASQPAYVELEQIKNSLTLTGTKFADWDLQIAALAASRGLDLACGRRFYLDADVNQLRFYTPRGHRLVAIDDLAVLTAVATDEDGDGVFETSWTLNTDFVLEPLNAAADGKPFTRLQAQRYARDFPHLIERSVRVTGQFGWSAVPWQIVQASSIMATKLLRRTRDAPLGLLALGGDAPTIARLALSDPDIRFLIGPLSKLV